MTIEEFNLVLEGLPLLSDEEKSGYRAIFEKLPDNLRQEFVEILAGQKDFQALKLKEFEESVVKAKQKFDTKLSEIEKKLGD